jgi:hypothetical protein
MVYSIQGVTFSLPTNNNQAIATRNRRFRAFSRRQVIDNPAQSVPVPTHSHAFQSTADLARAWGGGSEGIASRGIAINTVYGVREWEKKRVS